MAVSSRTKEVMADWTSHSKEPTKTKAVAAPAATRVAVVRVARGTIASRSRPIE